jgi:hypothetical protein
MVYEDRGQIHGLKIRELPIVPSGSFAFHKILAIMLCRDTEEEEESIQQAR